MCLFKDKARDQTAQECSLIPGLGLILQSEFDWDSYQDTVGWA